MFAKLVESGCLGYAYIAFRDTVHASRQSQDASTDMFNVFDYHGGLRRHCVAFKECHCNK